MRLKPQSLFLVLSALVDGETLAQQALPKASVRVSRLRAWSVKSLVAMSYFNQLAEARALP